MKRFNACAILVAAVVSLAALAAFETVQAQDSADATAAQPAQIGGAAPLFSLSDTDGKTHNLGDYLKDGKTVVLEWFNPDCPYVKKYHAGVSGNTTMRDAYAYAAKNGVVWLAVNSNRPGSQGSGLERNQLARADYKMAYPVLLDPEGTVGMAYGAKNTPQIFIISPDGRLHYDGGADDTKLDTDKPGVNYVINALKQLQAGEQVNPAQTPHPGCAVKYPK